MEKKKKSQNVVHLRLIELMCERSPKLGVLSKKRFEYFFRAPFFLNKWCGVATYFHTKK